jgi:hypothetical protein
MIVKIFVDGEYYEGEHDSDGKCGYIGHDYEFESK